MPVRISEDYIETDLNEIGCDNEDKIICLRTQ